MTMANTALEFDRPDVNVNLAKQYLKENEDNIRNMQLKMEDQNAWDYESRKKEILAKKIRENSKLICQLEYVTNKTPIEDSEKNIQLMLQYLFLSKKYRATKRVPAVIHNNTPLVLLIHAIEMGELSVCEERRAVCYLILKLFEETGLLLSSFKVNHSSGDNKDLYKTPSCTGIVSERSDLDSAVDAFLTSSSNSNSFWRLRQIYVQESIFQSFKEIIEFKVKLKGTKTEDHEVLKNLCLDFFLYKNKVLLFDYAGDVDDLRVDAAHVILIEAYRTNKELFSLLGEKARIGCVSLWCADLAEANEIAYNVPTSLVWINDYGNFDGPAEMSTFIVNLFQTNFSDEVDVPKRIIDSYETWRTYDNKRRAKMISDVLEKVIETSSLSDTKYDMSKLLELISNFKFSAVDVGNGKICVTLDSPVGFIYDESIDFDANVIGSLVTGNGVICSCFSGPPDYSLRLRKDLQLAGVPIWSTAELTMSDETKKIRSRFFHYRTKIVMTNFGTIFAN